MKASERPLSFRAMYFPSRRIVSPDFKPLIYAHDFRLTAHAIHPFRRLTAGISVACVPVGLVLLLLSSALWLKVLGGFVLGLAAWFSIVTLMKCADIGPEAYRRLTQRGYRA